PLAMLQVTTPWLVAVVLEEPPERVGFAQMMLSLPMLFLIMAGGLAADSFNRRKLLMLLHFLSCLPAWLMVWLAMQGTLSYGLFVLSILSISICGAFIRPAGDAMLSEIAGDQVQKIVTMATGTQFGLQIIGFGLAGNAENMALSTLMGILAVVLMSGTFMAFQLKPVHIEHPLASAPVRSGGFWSGLQYVWEDDYLRPIILMNLAIGVFYSGVYAVVFPLMIIQVYEGSAQAISISYILMMLGTISAVLILLWSGGIHQRQGRAFMLSASSGIIVLVLMSQAPNFYLYMFFVYLWGCGAGVSMSVSRTMVQENAPEKYRARILSIYSLGFMGGAPIGALFMGYSVAFLGPTNSMLFAAGGMLIITMFLYTRTGMWASA
ncbi:MAG: MFS transporter, partial [Pseudomonadota bacterium]